ncbi:DUF4479 domain-containing protein [Caldibacillus lycopersici]|uniref:DUF4479 domain-containing protein n=1 Tax=Perspicuibacillus lycopersici TaxID=1325689 RepID=A0AAE3IVP4_9BACI|nr:DUF4479 domain-containing tRNA-binding protein [Perspicuibacillus lycopersici]MCU9614241.1 DUF4479 domain-containing protein [Perspicuibacillus lycopersici]
MNIFYNKEGVGDTLLINIASADQESISHEKHGDVVRIFHEQTKETVGYNLFQASKYVELGNVNGQVELSEELVEQINTVLQANDFTEKLVADLSPKFVVGLVKEKEKHPNADKLSVCKVDIGAETLQIVCGAPNVEAGQKVVVAKIGAVMPSGLVIKPAELRGVASSGMLCSARELELPNAPQVKGILVLADDAPIGQPFQF